LLTNVEIEKLEDGAMLSVDEVLMPPRRSDFRSPRKRAPRDGQRRRRTRAHAIAIQSGNYLIGGYLHSPPGSDPIATWRRPLMVPLTDAWIEYWSGAGRTTQSIGTIIVNREQVDSMRLVTDEDLFGGCSGPQPTPDRIAF